MYIITSNAVGNLIFNLLEINVGKVNNISVNRHKNALFKSPLRICKNKHKRIVNARILARYFRVTY